MHGGFQFDCSGGPSVQERVCLGITCLPCFGVAAAVYSVYYPISRISNALEDQLTTHKKEILRQCFRGEIPELARAWMPEAIDVNFGIETRGYNGLFQGYSSAFTFKTPLGEAAYKGHYQVVDYLYVEGADANYLCKPYIDDPNFYTPLFVAYMENHRDIAVCLINKTNLLHADPENRLHNIILFAAMQSGSAELLDLSMNHLWCYVENFRELVSEQLFIDYAKTIYEKVESSTSYTDEFKLACKNVLKSINIDVEAVVVDQPI